MAHCLTLYDWPNELNKRWLVSFDQIFERLGSSISEGTGGSLNRNTNGSYVRVRKRLENFLERSLDSNEIDIRLRSKQTNPETPFFPSEIEVSLSADRVRRNKMCISVRHSRVSSRSHLFDVIGEKIFELTGPCYGAMFDFPVGFGPSFYLSSIATLPVGADWDANQAYTDRITRWRNRTRRDGVSPNDGFFREAYELNLLTDRHLQTSVGGRCLEDFAKAVGVITPLSYIPGMHRWDIPQQRLDEVRVLLEPTGLVLSA